MPTSRSTIAIIGLAILAALLSAAPAPAGTTERVETFDADGGGSVEASAVLDPPNSGWVEPMIQHQTLIADIANDRVWGIVCTVHESVATDSNETCWTMLRSFRPFGPLTG